MEIKTCEEYVLNRLTELEKEVTDLRSESDAFVSLVGKRDERIEQLEKFIGTRTSYSSYVTSEGDPSLDFDEPWLKYDPDAYNLMVELMNKYKKEEN